MSSYGNMRNFVPPKKNKLGQLPPPPGMQYGPTPAATSAPGAGPKFPQQQQQQPPPTFKLPNPVPNIQPAGSNAPVPYNAQPVQQPPGGFPIPSFPPANSAVPQIDPVDPGAPGPNPNTGTPYTPPPGGPNTGIPPGTDLDPGGLGDLNADLPPWERKMVDIQAAHAGMRDRALEQTYSDEARAARRAAAINASSGRSVLGGGFAGGQAQVALGGMEQRSKIDLEHQRESMNLKMAHLERLYGQAEKEKDRELQREIQAEMNNIMRETALIEGMLGADPEIFMAMGDSEGMSLIGGPKSYDPNADWIEWEVAEGIPGTSEWNLQQMNEAGWDNNMSFDNATKMLDTAAKNGGLRAVQSIINPYQPGSSSWREFEISRALAAKDADKKYREHQDSEEEG